MKGFEVRPSIEAAPDKRLEVANEQGAEIDAILKKGGYGGFFQKWTANWKQGFGVAFLGVSLLAAGCGDKEAKPSGEREGASRFPKAEEVVKHEAESDTILNRALKEISHDRFNFEPDGSLTIEIGGVNWSIAKHDIASFRALASRTAARMSASKTSEWVKAGYFEALKTHFKNLIDAQGHPDSNKINLTETQTLETGEGFIKETTKRHIEPINKGDKKAQAPSKPSTGKIRVGPNFDKDDDF